METAYAILASRSKQAGPAQTHPLLQTTVPTTPSSSLPTPASVSGHQNQPALPCLPWIRSYTPRWGPVHQCARPYSPALPSRPWSLLAGALRHRPSLVAGELGPDSSLVGLLRPDYSLDGCCARAAAAGGDQGMLFDRDLPPQAERRAQQGISTRPGTLPLWTTGLPSRRAADA
jgi:hypothetical protein